MKVRILLVLIAITSSMLYGTIINVPLDQSTIQAGINIAVDCDTVLVQPDTYFENIDYNGKNITIASLYYTTQDTSYIYQTIIDGNQNGSVVTFENGEDSTAVLCGFTITNGMFVSSMGGGGITIKNNSNPYLHDLIIKENFARNGGGIYCYNSSPIIHNLTIKNNGVPTSGGGGGIFLYNSNSIITNVSINGNFSYHHGGGIDCIGSNPILKNVIISENIASFMGGGIFLNTTTITLSNVVINHNEASGGLSPDGGGIYSMNSVSVLTNVTIAENTTWGEYGGIYCKDNSNFILLNCILWNDSSAEIYLENSSIDIAYSDIQGGWEGTGNINSIPTFINALEDDFHLQDTSSCIGAGINEIEIGGIIYSCPEFDLEGNPRPTPFSSMPDIGAFENLLGEPVGINNDQLTVSEYQLTNYPNPFNPITTIEFSIQHDSNVELNIFNIRGQKIKTLTHNEFIKGDHTVIWNGEDESNNPVSSGIYHYKLNLNGKTELVRKCLLLK